MARRLRLIAIVTTVGLAACTSYQPLPVEPVRNAEALDARSLDDPRLVEFIDRLAPPVAAEIRERRWSRTALTLAALYYHPDLEIARAKQAEAEAGGMTAREYPNPTVTVSPTKHTSPVDPPWTVGLATDLLLELPGKREAREDQADRLVEAARADLETATWQVRGGVSSAFTEVWTARARFDVLAHRHALEAQAAALVSRRRDEGAASEGDAGRAQAALADAAVAEEGATEAKAEANAALAKAVGVPIRAVEGVNLVFDTPGADAARDVKALRQAALVGRSDIKAAFAEYQAADAALRLQIARQYPDVRLGPSYTYQDADNEYPISLTVELPIFNQNQAQIAEADARRRAAAGRLLALQAQALNEVDAAIGRDKAAQEALDAADAARSDAQHRLAGVQHSFDAGQIGRPALVEAQLLAAQADLAQVDAEGERRREADALEAALQPPLAEGGLATALAAPSPGAGS
ncbi:MAG TPA: TolC family protein [Stellaceae bacterium]|nr:TolC family protein [Stellaceae bacterium]